MTAVSPPEALDEIKALFSWNPPRLIYEKLPTASTTSTPTRRLFYEKHFSSKLVLKRVERLPSLIQDLAKNVDKALNAALKTLPRLDGFFKAEYRAIDLRSVECFVRHENAVAMLYEKITGKYCSQVASTLALHPSTSFSRWLNLLFWMQSGPSTGHAIKDGLAVAHGVLRFRGNYGADGDLEAIVGSMKSEDRRVFEEIGESMSALATWEMKCTSPGTAEVMNAVLNLDEFSWMTCTALHCLSNRKHQKARENVERVVVGPDAQAPPWNFPDGSLNTSLVPENCDEEIDTLQQPATRSATSGSLMLPPQPSASRSSELTEHESPTFKGKKHKRDDGGAYQSQHDAQSLVHQAWAQAVRVDGTVIVLHSGNHEIVCIRHRGSQTLYVSDVIEPPTCVDPGYGKLHVGIYIAVVQDLMDRKQRPISQPKSPGDIGNLGDLISGEKGNADQLDHNRGSGSSGKGSRGHGGKHKGGPGVGNRKSGGLQDSAGRKVPTDDELVAIKKTIRIASDLDVVLLYLQYDVYDSPTPASFIRSAPAIMAQATGLTPPFSPQEIRTYGLEDCLTIILTSKIGWGSTGVVHRGTLRPEMCDGVMPLDVVVKLAFHSFQRYALRSEYEVYCRLRSRGVLQGVSLVKKPQHVLSVSDRKSALSTLESIHRAGIFHGDIRRENILIGDSGVTIIDFGHSKQCDDQKAKDKEFAIYVMFLASKITSECSVTKPLI